jgi:FO synthase subunit 1
MAQLKPVNVSMGLMLEQLTPTLLQTVHRHAPSKHPQVRLQQLVWAGELKIPMTTGLLLGIGETPADRRDSLRAIAALHQQYGHIQEVILQPHSPGTQQTWHGQAFAPDELVTLVAEARQILPPAITIQIPPNLLPTIAGVIACLDAGARDLGGIGPQDEVNPDYPHLTHQALATALQRHNWQLVPRLPVYPQYYDWLSAPLWTAVQAHIPFAKDIPVTTFF